MALVVGFGFLWVLFLLSSVGRLVGLEVGSRCFCGFGCCWYLFLIFYILVVVLLVVSIFCLWCVWLSVVGGFGLLFVGAFACWCFGLF